MSDSSLGILLMTSPESENTHTVIQIAGETIASGKSVEIFLMHDGLYNLTHQAFMELRQRGARIVVCGYNASLRSMEKMSGIEFGSQYDLAHLISRIDRFLAFT